MFKRFVRGVIKKIFMKIYDSPLPPLNLKEKGFLEKLKNEVHSFPLQEKNDCTPAEKAWNDYMNDLRELILNDDPREFLRWKVISTTMFVGNEFYIGKELKYLRSRRDWISRWKDAIKESQIGHPTPYFLYPAGSGNSIHLSYHLCQFEEKAGIRIDKINFVFEFGGGYGLMCRLFHNLGYKGKYVVYDLPLFSSLQKYYLGSLGLLVHTTDSFMSEKEGILCISDLRELKVILENYLPQSPTLFIATWSFSETPIAIRNKFLPLISHFDLFLISYQERFHEVNNKEFFGKWKNAQEDIEWHEWEISHLPKNYYLIGSMRR